MPTAPGVTVSAEAALRVPAVASAIRLIGEAVASLDVRVVAVGDDGGESDDPRNPVLPLLRDQANDWTSGFELIRDLISDALMSDAGGLAYVVRTADGRPVDRDRPGRGRIWGATALPPRSIVKHVGILTDPGAGASPSPSCSRARRATAD